MVLDLERELQESGEMEVPTSYIGERVLDRLKDTDGVAYVRFASVYRSFGDVKAFMEELQHLIQRQGGEGKAAP